MRRCLLAWQRWESRLKAVVSAYADDFVILCRGTATEALSVAGACGRLASPADVGRRTSRPEPGWRICSAGVRTWMGRLSEAERFEVVHAVIRDVRVDNQGGVEITSYLPEGQDRPGGPS